LKCCETLLAIDYRSAAKAAELIRKLLEDNSTQEVIRLNAIQKSLSDSPNILPKWLPLPFTIPNVGSLKQRDQESLRVVEDVLWVFYVCKHLFPLRAQKLKYLANTLANAADTFSSPDETVLLF
jgi:hypothetical protein